MPSLAMEALTRSGLWTWALLTTVWERIGLGSWGWKRWGLISAGLLVLVFWVIMVIAVVRNVKASKGV